MRLVLLLVLFAAWPVTAQQVDTLHFDLDLLEVTATRTAETAATAPLAVAIEVRDPIEMLTDPASALEGALRHIPGLWVADRQNFALGERLSVRGMGARAGFGVRGVQVVLDGIPLTMADGQSSLVIVDPGMLRRAELIRGPASTIWGNAGGGVLFLSSIPREERLANVRLAGGSFGSFRGEGEVVVPIGAHRAGLAVSHTARDGYRDHSAFEVTRGRAFGVFDLGRGARLTTVGALEWAPHQEHPGALTREEFEVDPRLAQSNFVDQGAGKDSRQGQVGAALLLPTPAGEVSVSGFGLMRSFTNPLPFAYIDVDRVAAGSRAALERVDGPIRWTIGFDTGLMRDDRRNWANVGGEPGELRLDQLETVSAVAGFSRAAAELGPWTLSLGLRHDRTRFAADDHLGDGSGERLLAAWSPSAGISFRARSATVYASASTAFETPTTTELVNQPDGSSGFNPNLEPQRTRGLELGVRGAADRGRLFYDLAAFALSIDDQLTPFEGDDGRTYYRNAEATRHLGVEALVDWLPVDPLRLGATYEFGRYTFVEAAEQGALDGNRLPGVPEHRLSVRATLSGQHAFAGISALLAGPTWADDANTARADGFLVLDLRLGMADLPLADVTVSPFLHVTNVLDTSHVGSVALNAAGGRFFEPGAGRAIHVGVSTRLLR